MAGAVPNGAITTLPVLMNLAPMDRSNGADLAYTALAACLAAPQYLEVRALHGVEGSRLQDAVTLQGGYAFSGDLVSAGGLEVADSLHVSLVCNADLVARALGVPVRMLKEEVYSMFTVQSLSRTTDPLFSMALSFESVITSDASDLSLWSSKQLRISINLYSGAKGRFSSKLSSYAQPRTPFALFDVLYTQMSQSAVFIRNLRNLGVEAQPILANQNLFNSRVNFYGLKHVPRESLQALTSAAKKAKTSPDESMGE